MGALTLAILVSVLVSDGRISKDGRADLRRPVIFDGKSIDEWIELLRSGNSDQRQTAAYALGRRSMASKAAIEELCRALRDKDVFVAQAADIALGRLGPYAVEALPALIKALKDGDEFTRQNVASTIVEIGPAAVSAVPALITALRDDCNFVRGNAAVALRTIGLRTPAITEALTKALGDKSDFVRCNAAWALWKLTGRKTGLPVLEATIKNGSDLGRWTAVSALTAMGAEAKQVAPTLRGVLQAHMEAPDVAMALWKTSRDPFAISALGKMLD
jgi:HEAT repeat protein